MTELTFLQLNDGWNAEPNDPDAEVGTSGSAVTLGFCLNPWAFAAEEGERGHLIFRGCSEWRLGKTNDEGWYRGQCRYSGIAPAWGEFYEIVGEDPLARAPLDWNDTEALQSGRRHFLFYLRDETFECFADEWSYSRVES